jgi:hypothetical protein
LEPGGTLLGLYGCFCEGSERKVVIVPPREGRSEGERNQDVGNASVDVMGERNNAVGATTTMTSDPPLMSARTVIAATATQLGAGEGADVDAEDEFEIRFQVWFDGSLRASALPMLLFPPLVSVQSSPPKTRFTLHH